MNEFIILEDVFGKSILIFVHAIKTVEPLKDGAFVTLFCGKKNWVGHTVKNSYAEVVAKIIKSKEI